MYGCSLPEQWKPVENRQASPVRDFERCVKDTPSTRKNLIHLVLQPYSWEIFSGKALECSSWNIQHNVPVGTLDHPASFTVTSWGHRAALEAG
jgi:hypothetical protein